MRKLLALAPLLFSACRGLGPPQEHLHALLKRPDPVALRRTARSRLESHWFTGEFKSLLIEDPVAGPRVRLQLLPDLGAKVLDMVVTPEGVTGHWAHDEEGEGRERLSRLMGISLLENAAPLTFERVLGARKESAGYMLEVRSILAGGDTRVFVHVDERGDVLSREYHDRGLRWHEYFEPAHVFVSDGMKWTLTDESAVPISPPSLGLFETSPPSEVDR